MTAKKKSTDHGDDAIGCTRTNDVFEAFQFPCDERAGGPCYVGVEDRDVETKGKDARHAYET